MNTNCCPHAQHPKRVRDAIHIACLCALLPMAGCQVLRPDPIPAGPDFAKPYNVAPQLRDLNEQPIEIGKRNAVIDSLGWVMGIPSKIILWDRRVDNHNVGEKTIASLAAYAGDSGLDHVKVRVNQYAPHRDWKRLRANRTMHWLPRYTLGTIALGYETILPGRLLGGDHYNPFTQTVHLYSDVPAIAYHELAHAKDFSRRKSQGAYALSYSAIPIWAETIATQDALSYVADTGDRKQIADAIDILYPAYGTYAGNVAGGLAKSELGLPIQYLTILASHLNARAVSRKIREGQDVGSITQVAVASENSTDSMNPIVISKERNDVGEPNPSSLVNTAAFSAGMIDGDSHQVMQTGFASMEDINTDAWTIHKPGTTYRDHFLADSLRPSLSIATYQSDLELTFVSRYAGIERRATVGDLSIAGIAAEIPLQAWTNSPLVASFSGFRGEQEVADPLLTDVQPFFPGNPGLPISEIIAIEYERTIADARLGYRFDANDLDEVDDHSRAIAADQLEVGLRFLHLNDRLEEPGRVILGGFTGSIDRFETRVFNNVLMPYLAYSRSLGWKRLELHATVTASAGFNSARKSYDKTLHDSLFFDSQNNQAESAPQVLLSTGQQLRVSGSYRYGRSVRVTIGTLLDRTTSIGSVFAERRNQDSIDEIRENDLLSHQFFVSAEASF